MIDNEIFQALDQKREPVLFYVWYQIRKTASVIEVYYQPTPIVLAYTGSDNDRLKIGCLLASSSIS